MIRAVCALLSLPLFLTSLDAIIIRHDRDDARYRELGASFPAVGAIGRAGEGTLIAPEWVLTAAHVATGFRRSLGITFDTGRYEVADVIAYPEWVDGGAHDLALIRLTSPVRGVTPLPVYDGDDERGATVTFVGRGGHGDGLKGPTGEDRAKRAATNVVDRIDDTWLFFSFDEPPAGTDLEGISGPGDSGGPALMQRDGKWFVVGISVWGRAGKYGRGTYGAQEGYTRVSRYVRWIERTAKS